MGRLKCYRILDKDDAYIKTYRHMGHVRQALNFLRLSRRWRVRDPFWVVEYKMTEVKRTRVEDV
jgi:hypothetical protein